MDEDYLVPLIRKKLKKIVWSNRMNIGTHEDQIPVPIADQIDRFIIWIGQAVAWVYLLLVLIIITQVILRKGFSGGLIVLEESEWHLYAIGFMIGLSYCQARNTHVRVDLFASRFSSKTQRIIEILGLSLLVLPFVYVVVYHSIDFVYDSWRTGESSDAPAGLPHRFLIKSVIPIAFSLLGLSVLSRIFRDTWLLVREFRHGN